MTRKIYIIIIMLNCIPLYVDAQEEWPKLPVLQITTIDSVMPNCSIVYAPEGCLGVSITDNKYVPGRMVMTLKGDTLYDSKEYVKGVSGMRIKRRGNSTGAYLAQHPYKLKLSKKSDLLRRGDKDFRHKEWVLLSMYTWNVKMTYKESNILNMAGTLVSRILEKEWTPAFEFVNVVLNGEYQGMYYLMESVNRGDKRVQTDETGFLIEHDVFWWNEDFYFKTDNQYPMFGYTYKYPDDNDVNDSIQTAIRNYMNQVESTLYAGGDIAKYVDMESFARWLLIHDILGTDDAAGCNRFLCKYDLKADNPHSSKLKMGPTWDYDSMFRSDSWSTLHTFSAFFYTTLLKRQDFMDIYLNLWKKTRPEILEKIQQGFDDYLQQYGTTFDESMKLHQTIYSGEGRLDFKSQVEEVLNKLTDRIHLLDTLMMQYEEQSGMNVTKSNFLLTGITDMQGKKYGSARHLPKGIYILNYSNGETRKVIIK